MISKENTNLQSGQTLIETLAAIFVLAMGITAVVGLATFTLGSSTNVTKQVVAMGLARQGVEAVKNMRDTNWLIQSQADTDCYNFKNQEQTEGCFRNWLHNASAYTLASGSYALRFNPDPNDSTFPSTSDIKFWHLDTMDPTVGYKLFSYPLNKNENNKYFYSPVADTGKESDSGYFRQVEISEENKVVPYDKDTAYSIIRVTSKVWWNDKKCPVASAFSYPASGSCRISLETVLTNWKNN